MLLGFLVSFLLFFWPHCDTQVWSPWLTELTHWPITNSLTQLFLIFFSCDFVAYCSLLFLFLLTFPLMDKHDRSLLLYLCCLSSSDCPLFSFLAFFKILLFLSLSTPTKNSSAHVCNGFYLIFSSLSFNFRSFHFFKCLMFCPFLLLFSFSVHPYTALFCWCMEHIWCLDSCG